MSSQPGPTPPVPDPEPERAPVHAATDVVLSLRDADLGTLRIYLHPLPSRRDPAEYALTVSAGVYGGRGTLSVHGTLSEIEAFHQLLLGVLAVERTRQAEGGGS